MKRFLVLAILVFVLGSLNGCGKGNRTPFDPAGFGDVPKKVLERLVLPLKKTLG